MKRTPKVKIDYTDWTVEQHAEHLRTHPSYQAEYAKYDAKGIDEFIDGYAKTKYEAFKERAFYQKEYEAHQTQFLMRAERYIDMILLKKLFNLQCLWRANKIKLPLIEACVDFDYWERNIRHCPFIPPITQEEIDICVAYLQNQIDLSDEECENYFPHGWLDYEKFKNQLLVDRYEEDEEKRLPPIELPDEYSCMRLPNFYTFWDAQQDTEHLIDLEDVRGKKEEKYVEESRRLYRENRRKALEAEGKTDTPYVYKDYLPTLHGYHHTYPDFIEATEDDESKELLKNYYHYFPKFDEDDAEKDYNFLKSFLDEPIAMIAHEDWRFSMKISVLWFKQCKAVEVLPYIYDTYLMEFDRDMPAEQLIEERVARFEFDRNEDNKHIFFMIDLQKKDILTGRKSLDGVENFDF
jgi:hypothetical protein